MKNIEFSYISDLHLDFYVHAHTPERKQEKAIDLFVENILPDVCCDVLVIAGDIGHYNNQNAYLFKSLKKHFKHVLFVTGNHDLYLINHNQQKKYFNNSFNRLHELRKIVDEIEDVHFLEGQIVDIDGVKYSGTSMWYDGSFARKSGMVSDIIQMTWKNSMNDNRMIFGMDRYDQIFNEQRQILDSSLWLSDVYLSHVGPIVPRPLPDRYNVPSTGFFYFDGEECLYDENAPKVWVFGHTHTIHDFMFRNTNMLCNPHGYPRERIEPKIVNYKYM